MNQKKLMMKFKAPYMNMLTVTRSNEMPMKMVMTKFTTIQGNIDLGALAINPNIMVAVITSWVQQ